MKRDLRPRIRGLFFLSLIVMSVFAARLVQVQGVQSAQYAARASRELLNSAKLPAVRGEITDVNGVVLARSVDAINITADQTLITDPAATATALSPILGIPAPALQATLTRY
jgi:cell division protein FtsI (penicillin-binding protein 3)